MVKNVLILIFVLTLAVSSVEVTANHETGCKPLAKNCIQVYEFCNFVGRTKTICGNVKDIEKLKFINEIRSVRVGPDTTVLTYEEANFKKPNFYIHQDETCIENEYSTSFEFGVKPEEVYNMGLRDNYNLWYRKFRLHKKSYGGIKVQVKGDSFGAVFSRHNGLNLSDYYKLKINRKSATIYKKSALNKKKFVVCSSPKKYIHSHKFSTVKFTINKKNSKILFYLNGKIILKCSDYKLYKNLKWVSFGNAHKNTEIRNVKVIRFGSDVKYDLSRLLPKKTAKKLAKKASKKAAKKNAKKTAKKATKKPAQKPVKILLKSSFIRRKRANKKSAKKSVKKSAKKSSKKSAKKSTKKIAGKKSIKKLIKKSAEKPKIIGGFVIGGKKYLKLSKKRCIFDWKEKWILKPTGRVSFSAYGKNNVGVAFSNDYNTNKNEYRIIIGAKKNKYSYVKKGKKIICKSKTGILKTHKLNNFKVKISKKNKTITVYQNGKVQFACHDKSLKFKRYYVGFSLRNPHVYYSKISFK